MSEFVFVDSVYRVAVKLDITNCSVQCLRTVQEVGSSSMWSWNGWVWSWDGWVWSLLLPHHIACCRMVKGLENVRASLAQGRSTIGPFSVSDVDGKSSPLPLRL